MCRSEDTVKGVQFSPTVLGSRAQAKVVNLGSKHLFLLNHLARPALSFKKC